MAQEKTLTVLSNCVIAYAKPGKTTSKGNAMVTGIINQRTPQGYFQASENFACFDADVQAQIMEVASKIAAAEQSAENSGESADRPKAALTVSLEGYKQSRAPKEGQTAWYHSFIITKVTLVDASALL